jgi:hypothetical protein
MSLYRRHGFDPLGAIQVGSSSTLVPMLRRPRYGMRLWKFAEINPQKRR